MNATLSHLFDSPPFDEAVSVLRNFLRQQGHNDNVHWIWRYSIISRRGSGSHKSANRRIFIDRHALADDDSIRKYYDTGVERGFGIALRVFCLADGCPLCYIYIPEDKTAAEYAMMSSLKCSIPTPCPAATFVNYRFVAAILRLFIKTPTTAWITNEVPLRPAIRDTDNAANKTVNPSGG
ncbi:MAG: hypothetical protein R3C59_15330 [Planctomycetaceae bacterium]